MELKNWFDAVDKDEFCEFLKFLDRINFVELEFDDEYGDCIVRVSKLMNPTVFEDYYTIYGPFGVKIFLSGSTIPEYIHPRTDYQEKLFFEFMCEKTSGKICNGQTYTEAWLQAHRLAEAKVLKGDEHRVGSSPENLDRVKRESLARIKELDSFAKNIEEKLSAETNEKKDL